MSIRIDISVFKTKLEPIEAYMRFPVIRKAIGSIGTLKKMIDKLPKHKGTSVAIYPPEDNLVMCKLYNILVFDDIPDNNNIKDDNEIMLELVVWWIYQETYNFRIGCIKNDQFLINVIKYMHAIDKTDRFSELFRIMMMCERFVVAKYLLEYDPNISSKCIFSYIILSKTISINKFSMEYKVTDYVHGKKTFNFLKECCCQDVRLQKYEWLNKPIITRTMLQSVTLKKHFITDIQLLYGKLDDKNKNQIKECIIKALLEQKKLQNEV